MIRRALQQHAILDDPNRVRLMRRLAAASSIAIFAALSIAVIALYTPALGGMCSTVVATFRSG